MFENYLCINGKKTELTDEQMQHWVFAFEEVQSSRVRKRRETS